MPMQKTPSKTQRQYWSLSLCYLEGAACNPMPLIVIWLRASYKQRSWLINPSLRNSTQLKCRNISRTM